MCTVRSSRTFSPSETSAKHKRPCLSASTSIGSTQRREDAEFAEGNRNDLIPLCVLCASASLCLTCKTSHHEKGLHHAMVTSAFCTSCFDWLGNCPGRTLRRANPRWPHRRWHWKSVVYC